MKIAHDQPSLLRCLELANISLKKGCFPAGAVIINSEGEVLGEGYNTARIENKRIFHAEVNAVLASKSDIITPYTTLYTSLEPCFMCMGVALINKINRIVWLANDYWAGGMQLMQQPVNYINQSGILLEQSNDQHLIAESVTLIKKYFEGRDQELYARITTAPMH